MTSEAASAGADDDDGVFVAAPSMGGGWTGGTGDAATLSQDSCSASVLVDVGISGDVVWL
jgi:hypothetical protein